MTDSLWKLDRLSLFGQIRPRLDDVSLEIGTGTTAIIGYSGAGKTSLVNVLVGFSKPDRGRLSTQIPHNGDRLPIYWVPQQDGLWPHLTGAEHLTVVMPAGRDAKKPVDEFLDRFDLADKRNEYPDRLSQGERARLSVARALASGASTLVMDEPLAHVDPGRAGNYRREIREVCREQQASLVFATHSAEVVLGDAERVICLKRGRVLCEGSVHELYYQPKTEELAKFLGPANWLTVRDTSIWLTQSVQQQAAGEQAIGQQRDAAVCVRPEQLLVARCEEGTLVVDSTQFSGSVEEVTLVHEPSQQRRRFFHRPRAGVLKTGDRVVLKTLLLLLVCLLLFPGCNDAETAELPVSEFHSWSLPPDGPKLPAPRGLTVGPDDSLYVLDDAGRVLVYDRLGTLNRKWRMPASEVGKPEGICILTDGRIAVADTHYHRVVYFDQTGDVLKIIGTLGQEPGQFKYPVALTQDDQENLYVCEYGSNDRVQRFSNDGEFLLEFGSHGTEAGQFQRPSGIVWHEGRVYVADAFNNRIQIFSEDGDFLAFLDSPQSETSLDYPYDLCLSAEGHLYAVEYRAGRVTGLDLSGRVLGVFGRSGRGQRQFATPWGIAVSQEGRLFVADTGNRRIVELRR